MSTPEQTYAGGSRPFTAGGRTAAPPAPASSPAEGSGAHGSGVSAPAAAAARAPRGGPRKVRLTVARVDPWSVMKLAFLVSVAIGIAFVVAISVLWTILDNMGVFTDVDRTVGTVLGSAGSQFNLMNYIGFGRVISLATVIGVIDVFLLTALATLGAFLYNVCSSLVGGVHLTLSDD